MELRRRGTLALLVAWCVAPRAARAQAPGRVYRLAWLSGTSIPASAVWGGFVASMRELGWVQGVNYTVDNLRYGGNPERIASLAAEAVERKFDLIICAGTPPSLAAQRATSTIPIVFYFVGDPVGAGLVASLSHPGGNVTGLGGLGAGIYAKMLELLMEAAPRTKRIAMLSNSTYALHTDFTAEAESAARSIGVELKPVELRSPADIEKAFATIARDRADALLILGQPFLINQGARIARLAVAQRLPTIDHYEGAVPDGILMAYGSRLSDDVTRLPHYIDRILNGASPASLPVEQPTRFYLTINLKTAKAIGVAIPASLRQRADQLIR